MKHQLDLTIKGVFSRIGFALTFSMIALNIVQLMMTDIMNKIDPNLLTTGWGNFILIGIGFYGFAFLTVYFLVRRIPAIRPEETITLTVWEFCKYAFISYSVMILLNFVTLYVVTFIEIIKSDGVVNPTSEMLSTGSSGFNLVCLVILSPIIEEVLFRKIILDRTRIYGDKVAIVFTAVAFGLYHGNLSQLIYATGLGMILAYLVLKTNQIWYAIGVHMFVNSVGSLLLPLLLNNASSLIMIQGIIIFIFSLIALGLVLFFKDCGKVTLLPGLTMIDKEHFVQTVWLNPGVFAFLLFSISMIIMELFIL